MPYLKQLGRTHRYDRKYDGVLKQHFSSSTKFCEL